MDRRRFFTSLTAGLLAMPLTVEAQPAANVYRIGLVFVSTPLAETAGSDPRNPLARAFVEQLRELGWVEGQNLVIERRSAEGKPDRAAQLFADLVRLKVDVIVTVTNPFARAARQATSTIPIVMAVAAGMVENGFVASLARPGGNLTGLDIYADLGIRIKRLEVLKEAVPTVSRVAYILESPPAGGFFGPEALAAARARGVAPVPVIVDRSEQFADAFATIRRQGLDAVGLADSSFNFAHRRLIANLLAQYRLPAVSPFREFAEAGVLMSYGADLAHNFRRAAVMVDKILKGAKPADLPVEQPARYELVINLKTAKALGLTIPPSVLVRADEVIQ